MKETKKRGYDFIDRTRPPSVDWVKVFCYAVVALVVVGVISVL